MFPVVSNLRRSALKIIYTQTPEIDLIGKHFCLDLSKGQWEKSTKPLMFKLEASSESPFERAVKLCAFENDIYDKCKAGRLQYTLVFGDEREDGDIRSVRIGIIKGILVSQKGGGLSPPPPASINYSSRRPLPPGVVLDER